MSRWLKDVGHTHKVPQVFVYGKDDAKAADNSLAQLQNIVPNFQRGAKAPVKDYEFTGEFAVPGTKLAANQLLQPTLETQSWIIEKYIGPLMEKRGNKEPKTRESDKNVYYWVVSPNPTTAPILASDQRNPKAPKPLPTSVFGLTGPQ
jgi:hypothetical protein